MSDCSTNAWKAPKGKPTLKLHAEFDSGNDWDYTLALNGRRLQRFEIDGVRQVDAPERDWDSGGDRLMTEQIDKLRTLNGELCAEINRQEKRIRELESLLNVEIVRCRDCVWARLDHSDHDYRGEYRCNMWITDVSADGYCWRGMRKEVGA